MRIDPPIVRRTTVVEKVINVGDYGGIYAIRRRDQVFLHRTFLAV